jgi:hypothetical protein
MATQPQPKPADPKPAPKPTDPDEAAKAARAKPPERDAQGYMPKNWPSPPVKTVQEEQLERSAEIEKVGVEKWKADHDTVTPEERAQAQQVVPGVGAPPPAPGTSGWAGSTRTTPEANAAQHRAAP